MIIRAPGKYRLLEDYQTRGTISIRVIPKGKVIEIKCVDKTYRKVIGPSLVDWAPWDMPVEECEGEP